SSLLFPPPSAAKGTHDQRNLARCAPKNSTIDARTWLFLLAPNTAIASTYYLAGSVRSTRSRTPPALVASGAYSRREVTWRRKNGWSRWGLSHWDWRLPVDRRLPRGLVSWLAKRRMTPRNWRSSTSRLMDRQDRITPVPSPRQCGTARMSLFPLAPLTVSTSH